MFQRRTGSRFRRRTNGRNNRPHGMSDQNRQRQNSFTNGQSRNNFRQSLSAEKLFDKYSSLAKEAMSSGDKTLSENYLQHADHYMRVIEDKNRNRNQNKIEDINKPNEDKKSDTNNINISDNAETKEKV